MDQFALRDGVLHAEDIPLPRLAEEIGFFIPVEGGVTVVLSLMRAQATGPFRSKW